MHCPHRRGPAERGGPGVPPAAAAVRVAGGGVRPAQHLPQRAGSHHGAAG